MDVYFLFLIVFSAFFLFAVLLPLAGVVAGLFCYYVLPYLFGGVVVVALMLLAGVKLIMTWWVWAFTALWASAVWVIKALFRKLGDEIEHYHAAHATILFGAPYRRRRNELQNSFAAEVE